MGNKEIWGGAVGILGVAAVVVAALINVGGGERAAEELRMTATAQAEERGTDISMAVQKTVEAQFTSTSLNTPIPTNTLLPIDTPTISATPTPIPPTSTATDTDTPLPTDTPTITPTETPIPTDTLTPTPIYTTDPTTVLPDGETAHGDGLDIIAEIACVLDQECPDAVTVDFTIKNITDQRIVLPTFGGDSFLIQLDTGEKLYVLTKATTAIIGDFWCDSGTFIEQYSLNRGQELKWTWTYILINRDGCGRYHYGKKIQIPNESREFIIVFPSLGTRFEGASWMGTIPR